jgi:hypothetical protein
MGDMTKKSVWSIIFIGLTISLIIAGVVSFYADANPDGLERVAEDQGFLESAQESANANLVTADYGIAGVEDERLSVGLAGVLGVVVVIAVAFGLFWFLGRGKKTSASGG